ncbi:hypothetical protein J422_06090 [Methanocaldococcus villosus KIN24-T80]|uniref:SigmaK-factor processing regulatory BofA n=1 Tax=Methanocaldococcus villosus KIN24-T80 TaxID=1069083 RepID=N6V0A5_9EURY|nr:pro-sigmaK processing inhibitor BofA family protein [Methanocaldococcus villosus]ENN95748.1 hypothetical protein J422_06090 [Methanocaldococcus villosus KIN24-T80]
MDFYFLAMIGILILVAILIIKLTLKIIRYLAINTAIGIILIFILKFLGINIKLNLINLLIIAIGGVVGVFILLILHFLHI